ncbi:hypothetical protein Godav_009397 [Gossypium davidsonii]|uniref:Uncharacterized protein n=1 Tax=Gossypium davidsonii TaxID=34287 RepID=A0A7J8SD29_GOSDV|nr:hypothetical protein [Gossypium davidsonii]
MGKKRKSIATSLDEVDRTICRYVVHLAKSGTDRLRMLISHVLANCNGSAGKMLESMNQIRFSSLLKDKLRKKIISGFGSSLIELFELVFRKKSISGFGDNKREDQELQQWISSVTFRFVLL